MSYLRSVGAKTRRENIKNECIINECGLNAKYSRQFEKKSTQEERISRMNVL